MHYVIRFARWRRTEDCTFATFIYERSRDGYCGILPARIERSDSIEHWSAARKN